MGVIFVEGIVTGPEGRQATVRFLVDSGADYTLLSDRVWQVIGLTPRRSQTFTLADGTGIERQVSECHISLVLNPFTRQRQPMRMLLARAGGRSRG